MPVKTKIPFSQGLFSITFTCYRWMNLIERIQAYDAVYSWFDYLKTQQHDLIGYVVMPNHIHAMIHFVESIKCINRIIGDGKRFLAYEMIKRLEAVDARQVRRLAALTNEKDRRNGKLHQVWEPSFDWKHCTSFPFAWEKLKYIHNNPCVGKWQLADEPASYEHSSARFYASGIHAAYPVRSIWTLDLK